MFFPAKNHHLSFPGGCPCRDDPHVDVLWKTHELEAKNGTILPAKSCDWSNVMIIPPAVGPDFNLQFMKIL